MSQVSYPSSHGSFMAVIVEVGATAGWDAHWLLKSQLIVDLADHVVQRFHQKLGGLQERRLINVLAVEQLVYVKIKALQLSKLCIKSCLS
jgi:hypothetical protein